ncbi:MAG: chemotaxis protein CheB [Chloroflexota bacterium]
MTAKRPSKAKSESASTFPVVGIGASAGGLSAFEAFFAGMPAETDPGMAFVLVQHLAPDHKSILTDLIRRYTRMQVFEVEDGMVVQPNVAYIIPPNRDMAFLNGTLQLMEPSAPRGQRLPIDFFFRSLAADQHEKAICIVLSGTGSDGTLGVRAIKGEGGMVMAQNPASTEYDGMPRSAIATGLVDYEMPPAEMAAQLIAYVAHAFSKISGVAAPAPRAENALRKVFVLLRAQTGHDFSLYKPSTVNRRIERRMAVHQIETIDGYVKYLQQTPAEVEALFRDLLIGVTSFFRDAEAFDALETAVIPKLFAAKREGSVVRVWVPGCSTGEEAYSIAMLMAEYQEAAKRTFGVQIFATDIDSEAIATARTGIYPASVAADISPERLARYFVAEPDKTAYRIHKGLRDLLVFSEQSVIKDPPFSKIDLISCRNLLIYMGGELQKKIVPLFHYALNPNGFLFLGTSETVGEFVDLFTTVDRKSKIYQRQEDILGVQRVAVGRFMAPLTAIHAALPLASKEKVAPKAAPLRELTEQALLQQVVAAGALVTSQGDILYLHGRTGLYLEPTPGEAEPANILKMAREGLRRDLITTLRKAVAGKEAVSHAGLRVRTNGGFTTVNLTVRPVTAEPGASSQGPLYLVILEEVPSPSPEPAPADAAGAATPGEGGSNTTEADARVAALTLELRSKDEYLQTANEELETSNEELKSSNEEMQSVNEELQSTNEELETSKEELQSVNEELATVNAELQTKVVDLSRINNDMSNLLAGTGIGTVFVDLGLRILRFTPSATRVINLIASDVGRPVGHLVANLVGYDSLVADAQAVLDTLVQKVVDVQTTTGAWYTMRILPYRTQDNVIEGAVITFADITEAMKAGEAQRESEEKFHRTFESMPFPMALMTMEGRLIDCNGAFCEAAMRPREEMLGRTLRDLGMWPDTDQRETRETMVEALQRDGRVDGLEIRARRRDGQVRIMQLSARVLTLGPEPVVLSVAQDVTERREAEESLRKANDLLRLAVVVRDAHDAITVQDLDGRIIAWNPGAVRAYGWSEAEALEMNVRDRIPDALREEELAALARLGRAEILEPYRTQRIARDGTVVEVTVIATVLVDEAGVMYAVSTTERPMGSDFDRTVKASDAPQG